MSLHTLAFFLFCAVFVLLLPLSYLIISWVLIDGELRYCDNDLPLFKPDGHCACVCVCACAKRDAAGFVHGSDRSVAIGIQPVSGALYHGDRAF